MNGCDCIVSFKEIKEDADPKPETIEFSVAIVRDGETFYEKAGSIPILNDDLKSHISVAEISDELTDLEIFYTYIW